VLRVEEVSRTFAGPDGPVEALKNVTLSVERGQVVSVRGPSGCGKTTLLLVCGGLLRPGRGRVLVGSQDVYAMSPERRARLRAESIGFVFQQFHLVPYLTVVENVLAPSLAGASLRRGAREHAAELANSLGLERRRRHLPSELSMGERQRTALARALFCSPSLLLADEPTGNLDDESGQVVLDQLAEFAEEGGAVLLVSHDQRAACRADRTLAMRDGMIESL